ncbi:hypothetical protein CFT12S00416_07850 [Campylobacter fetus subsp. testudinum]|nr:hypothetical protein CFT12S00416_07850 [Campylobacter fetus subsp. testudinum]
MEDKTQKLLSNLNTTLYKDQFRLKLGIVYLFCSGFNFIMLGVCYVLYMYNYGGLDFIMCLYFISMLVYYRFEFKYTRNGENFNVLILKLFSDFNIKVNSVLRQNLQENSCKISNSEVSALDDIKAEMEEKDVNLRTNR